MEEQDQDLNLGILCRCCDHTYTWHDLEGFSAKQRRVIEELCTLCAEGFRHKRGQAAFPG
jgi:hypothetical protein